MSMLYGARLSRRPDRSGESVAELCAPQIISDLGSLGRQRNKIYLCPLLTHSILISALELTSYRFKNPFTSYITMLMQGTQDWQIGANEGLITKDPIIRGSSWPYCSLPFFTSLSNLALKLRASALPVHAKETSTFRPYDRGSPKSIIPMQAKSIPSIQQTALDLWGKYRHMLGNALG